MACLIDRAKPVWFSFEGRAYHGLDGRRNRLGAGGCRTVDAVSLVQVSPAARHTHHGRARMPIRLVQLPDEPNTSSRIATRFRAGLDVFGPELPGFSGEGRLCLAGQVSAGSCQSASTIVPCLSRKGAWKRWEPRIRAMAGLGKINRDAAQGYYDKAYGFHDVDGCGWRASGHVCCARSGQSRARRPSRWMNGRALGGSLTYARFTALA